MAPAPFEAPGAGVIVRRQVARAAGREDLKMRRWRALAIVPVAAMLVTGSVQAQDATPEPAGDTSSRAVTPADCIAEPRAPEDIFAILAIDGEGVPAPAMSPITPPLGEIADSATETSVKDVARILLACFNGGDIPRAAALMTENGVQRAYWGLTIDEENRTLARERIAAAPEPRADNALIRLIAVTDVSVLPDGRVAAFVVINEPLLPPGGPETLLFIFAEENGVWLVDDFIDFSIVPPATAEATPAA
jgi:hypothetical protein